MTNFYGTYHPGKVNTHGSTGGTCTCVCMGETEREVFHFRLSHEVHIILTFSFSMLMFWTSIVIHMTTPRFLLPQRSVFHHCLPVFCLCTGLDLWIDTVNKLWQFNLSFDLHLTGKDKLTHDYWFHFVVGWFLMWICKIWKLNDTQTLNFTR